MDKVVGKGSRDEVLHKSLVGMADAGGRLGRALDPLPCIYHDATDSSAKPHPR